MTPLDKLMELSTMFIYFVIKMFGVILWVSVIGAGVLAFIKIFWRAK